MRRTTGSSLRCVISAHSSRSCLKPRGSCTLANCLTNTLATRTTSSKSATGFASPWRASNVAKFALFVKVSNPLSDQNRPLAAARDGTIAAATVLAQARALPGIVTITAGAGTTIAQGAGQMATAIAATVRATTADETGIGADPVRAADETAIEDGPRTAAGEMVVEDDRRTAVGETVIEDGPRTAAGETVIEDGPKTAAGETAIEDDPRAAAGEMATAAGRAARALTGTTDLVGTKGPAMTPNVTSEGIATREAARGWCASASEPSEMEPGI